MKRDHLVGSFQMGSIGEEPLMVKQQTPREGRGQFLLAESVEGVRGGILRGQRVGKLQSLRVKKSKDRESKSQGTERIRGVLCGGQEIAIQL